MTDYITRLHAAIEEKGTAALVGLDPREGSLPEEFRAVLSGSSGDVFDRRAAAYEAFCKAVVDVVAPLVPAVKPQVAFFEDCGPAGMSALRNVMNHARKAGLIVIADAKRGDIGSTAEAYASAWLAGDDPEAAPYPADALTVNAYLGPDTLEPFVKAAHERGAGLYVLVRTSNPGSGAFQSLVADGRSVCHHVAAVVEGLNQQTKRPDGFGSIGAVVGATHPDELRTLRGLMPATPFLIPGYGAQGGTAAEIRPAFDSRGFGGLVNSSRNVIFAHQRKEYREIAQTNGWRAAVELATREFVNDFALKGLRKGSGF